jgi:hypothetical protein
MRGTPSVHYNEGRRLVAVPQSGVWAGRQCAQRRSGGHFNAVAAGRHPPVVAR